MASVESSIISLRVKSKVASENSESIVAQFSTNNWIRIRMNLLIPKRFMAFHTVISVT